MTSEPPASTEHHTEPHTDGSDAPELHSYLVRVLCFDAPRVGSARYSLRGVRQVALGRGSDNSAIRETREGFVELRLRVADRRMSGNHATLMREGDRWKLRDLGSTNGTLVDGERVDEVDLCDGDLVQLGHTAFLFREGVSSRRLPRDLIVSSTSSTPPGFETLLPSYGEQLERLVRVAASPISVLLRGETGTGKEVLARSIHQLSKRPGPFVAVNCGALPEDLVEAQLFGHAKGAFSGATHEAEGFVRAANYGTLFLDEIGDLPAASQPALLRVLQESEVVPVGTTRPIPVDVRIVSATHQQLEELMDAGAFRRDLYARLAGFVQHLPPLRERREDVGLLLATLLQSMAEAEDVSFRADAARLLLSYPWPLNVRELSQCLSAALVLAEDRTIALTDLPDTLRRAPEPARPRDAGGRSNPQQRALKTELVEHLAATQGNVSEVARRMGKARQQVQRWLRRFGVNPAEFKR